MYYSHLIHILSLYHAIELASYVMDVLQMHVWKSTSKERKKNKGGREYILEKVTSSELRRSHKVSLVVTPK